MKRIIKTKLITGCFYISIEEEDFNLLCSSPANVLQHLEKKHLLQKNTLCKKNSKLGPCSILLSDILVQNHQFSNLCESPIFHMFYKQNILDFKYKNNKIKKPIIIGDCKQIDTQLEYITRGNYGLLNDFEFSNLDLSSTQISNIMNAKLYYDFKNVFNNNDLLDLKYLNKNEKLEIRDNIFIQRSEKNIFKLSYKNENISIDLNLQEGEKYESAYFFDYHKLPYEDFLVLHTRCMSSIIMFHGKIYLLDTPANIIDTLNALGIGLNEIEGIFNTSLHDDNFIGLSSLLLRDQKLKYYSTKVIKYSLMKKLASLLRMPLSALDNYFEFKNLEHEVWNKIDDFYIKPFLGIDSVESNIFYFKCLNKNKEYISYAHLRNIPSLEDMKKMIKNDDDFGLSQTFYNNSKENFTKKVNLKKISYRNIDSVLETEFDDDLSDAIILMNENSHSFSKKIRTRNFADIDILIKSSKNYLEQKVKEYLFTFFRDVKKDNFISLLDCEIKNIKPNTIILNEDKESDFVYLLLSGSIKKYKSFEASFSYLSAGIFLAFENIIENKKILYTYKTRSYVNVLEIPKVIYMDFIKKNNLQNKLKEIIKKEKVLKEFPLFSSFLSPKTIDIIVNNIIYKKYTHNEEITEMKDGLCLIIKGEVTRFLYDQKIHNLGKKDFFGERNILEFKRNNYKYKAVGELELYIIPKIVLKNIPIIHWKLFTKFQESLIW